MNQAFVHLHLHTEYSITDSVIVEGRPSLYFGDG